MSGLFDEITEEPSYRAPGDESTVSCVSSFSCSAPSNACSLEPHPLLPLIVVGTYELQDPDKPDLNVSQSREGAVVVYDQSLNVVASKTFPCGVLDLKLRPDSSTFAAAMSDGSIRLLLVSGDAVEEEMRIDGPGICLSVSWSSSNLLLSSHSDSTVQLYDVAEASARCIESAHKFPYINALAECWTVASHSGVSWFVSGGDDGSLKCWDIASLARIWELRDPYTAGVTAAVISTVEDDSAHLLAGSYDFTLLLLSVSIDGSRKSILRKIDCGGGVWRIKPAKFSSLVLVGAMHYGCVVLDPKNEEGCEKIAEFREHDSMAYGADWVENDTCASCSFYDRKVFVWTLP